MAPRTRSYTGPRRGAANAKRSGVETGADQKAAKKPKVPCEICGKPQGEGAGMARHMSAKHPRPAAVPDPPAESTVDVGRVIPAPPDSLTGRALDLWRLVVNEFDLRADELRVLEDACREAMLIDKLANALDDDVRLVVRGSMGQPSAHPLLAEIRQHRTALAALFARLKLSDDNVSGESAAERRIKARAAANARWRRGS